MELFNCSIGPSVDRGVLARLKRLDPLLSLTFCSYSIDPETSTPLPVHPSADWYDDPIAMARLCKRGSTCYLLDPAYHLWTKSPLGKYILVASYPMDQGGFGYPAVARLERDVARYMRPSDIVRMIEESQRGAKQAEYKRHASYRSDMIGANESRIEKLLDGDHGTRQARIMSYPGQGNRGTPGDVRKSDKEDGWEKFDSKEEYDKSY